MPKFFCDYCDVYLTHDSMSVRKSHNAGRNHLRNVIEYYQQIGHERAQSVIDTITSSYAAEGQPNPMLHPPSGAPGFPPMGFPGMPPPGFAPPGGVPGIIPPGGRGMPFPPFGQNVGGPPFMPNGPPQGLPPNMQQFQSPPYNQNAVRGPQGALGDFNGLSGRDHSAGYNSGSTTGPGGNRR